MGASQYPTHGVNNAYPISYSSAESVPLYSFQTRSDQHHQPQSQTHPQQGQEQQQQQHPPASQQHQSQQPPVHSLPPLQRPDTNGMQQPMYEHQRNPAPPGGPPSHQAPTPSMSQYPQVSQSGDRAGMYSIPPYSTHGAYATSSAMMPPSTLAAAPHSVPQPIAPAPPNNRGAPMAPVLRPMPPHGALGGPQSGVPSPYVMQQAPPLGDEDQPTHVVGSQGRRGILPSAPGRPQATLATPGASKTTVIPQKDEDGKFPCPHCQKTYLHAKHLKRHLLRHTGDRPYMCVLCRDTFSRSDILKRHFQKCCIRRGNPTGISHLSHPQAHVKKHAAAQQQQQQQQPGQHVPQPGQAPPQQGQPQSAPKPPGGMGGEGDHLHGLGSLQSEGIHYAFPVSDSINNLQGDQSQLSRTNSLGRLENGGAAGQDRAGSLGSASRSGSFGGGYGGGDLPQQMPGYSMPPSNQNGMPMYGGDSNSNHASGMEWAQMFQSEPDRNQNRP